MADEKTNEIHVDEDDYTELEQAEAKRSKKNAEKSIDETRDTTGASGGSPSGKSMGFGMKVLVGKSVVDNLRTEHMKKQYKKDQKSYNKEAQAQRSSTGGEKTMGDVFAAAYKRLILEQKAEKMRKLQEKIEKREAREKKVGDMINNVMQAVGQASRTSGMQNSIGQLTANTGGIKQRDIPTLNDDRYDDDMQAGG